MQIMGTESGAFSRLRSAMDSLLDPVSGYTPEERIRNFLRLYELCSIRGEDFEGILLHFTEGLGGPYARSDILPTAPELYAALSVEEKRQLKDHYFQLLTRIAEGFPSLKSDFPLIFQNLSRSR